MTGDCFRFADFELDGAERQLRRRDGAVVELSGRYLDALTLLVREGGRLVSKDRFMDEVWRGVPVTDEALTQCIRSLRRQLGDEAGRPRFIETVPKHGYRFIAPVEAGTEPMLAPTRVTPTVGLGRLRLMAAGTAGAGMAGLVGGIFYGFTAAAQPAGVGVGAASTVVVIALVTLLIALLGGAAVAGGIAALASPDGRPLQQGIAGGALGGLAVGGVVRLIGLDAFNLLLGRAPGGITGPFEGVLLGAAVGTGAWLAFRREPQSPKRAVAAAAGIGGLAGLIATLAGGRLMAGSLDLLAREFPGSRLRLDPLARLLGESEFGWRSAVVTGTLEGALFAGCMVAAMLAAARRWRGL
jgi:DNA-binding winged helix-turn-helix (wHTH) protein